jgi:hypothetical protein
LQNGKDFTGVSTLGSAWTGGGGLGATSEAESVARYGRARKETRIISCRSEVKLTSFKVGYTQAGI